MSEREQVWKWLDKNQTFLVNYLDNAPQELLRKLAITKVQKHSFSRVVSKLMVCRIAKKLFLSGPTLAAEMNENEKFMELVKDIASEMDVNVVCYKLLRNVITLIKGDRSSLFLANDSRDNRYLISKFKVTQTSTFEEFLIAEDNAIKIPFGKNIAGHVALTNETVNITDAHKDPRFNQDEDKATGYRTHSILAMPILNQNGECIGVAQITNKSSGDSHVFSKDDITAFARYLMFCGIVLTNAQLFEMAVNQYQRNEILLNLARDIFSEQTSLENLVKKISIDIQEVTKCEICSVYLLHDFADSMAIDGEVECEKAYKCTKDVVFSTAFDMYVNDRGSLHISSPHEIAECKSAEVARDVVLSKTPLNISNIDMNSRYGGTHLVNKNRFQIQSILSMPIRNSKGYIIGVTQQMNKIGTVGFNENDEKIIRAFSIFTGLGIHNCIIYQNVCKLMAKQKASLEMLSFHVRASRNETNDLVAVDIPPADHWKVYTFEMDDLLLSEFDLSKMVIRMFMETGIIKQYKVPYGVLCSWTQSVKKNYRAVTYHNWRHAFNVCQSCFAMLYAGGLADLFNDLEVFGLLVACLCHDLDHRGTNNTFQIKMESPLATLYSTSVMEHHHFDHCIMILNSEGNNIFGALSSEDYKTVLSYIQHAILSTDISKYFEKKKAFKGCSQST